MLKQEMSKRRSVMKILMIASELAPFVKTGGLANMVNALGITLSNMGHDVRVVLPRYYRIDRKNLKAIPGFFVWKIVVYV